MTASQPIWHGDPRDFGGGGYYPRVIYVGPANPPPELLRAALIDSEDRPPLRRSDHDFCTCWECTQPNVTELELLNLMPQDQDDPREVATIAPETDREPETEERKTQPPGAADAEATRVMATMLPEAPLLPERAPLTLEDSYLDRAIRVVASAGAKLAEDKEERRQQHEAVLHAIHRADENASRNYEMLRREVIALKRSDLLQDGKIADLRLELAAMRDQLTQAIGRIDALERRIPHAPPEASATPGE